MAPPKTAHRMRYAAVVISALMVPIIAGCIWQCDGRTSEQPSNSIEMKAEGNYVALAEEKVRLLTRKETVERLKLVTQIRERTRNENVARQTAHEFRLLMSHLRSLGESEED